MQDTGEQYTLTKAEHQLLLGLVNCRNKQSRKVFDKKDNCFIKPSIRDIEAVTYYSSSSIGRLFKKLSDLSLLKYVTNAQGDRVRMLSPFFMPLTSNTIDRTFKYAMFSLGSYNAACKWSKHCRTDGLLYDFNTFCSSEVIDFDTGEVIKSEQKDVIRELSILELKRWDKHRQSYSCTDRTKRRVSAQEA
ncbi:MarR family transcriptional regulator [Vibrio chaetopteri]|uniref:MarR family transcriptional regulator n=1 Tax=Vibrio chaetopteri TaxID=3016528 RepID=UPI003AB5B233